MKLIQALQNLLTIRFSSQNEKLQHLSEKHRSRWIFSADLEITQHWNTWARRTKRWWNSKADFL
jgi:hypothetical protein